MTSKFEPIVIVGAGQAGFEASTSLRRKGFVGPVTLLGDESDIPYQRPPLSKAYLNNKEDLGGDSIALRPEAYFADHRIDLRCSARVVSVQRDSRTVTLYSREAVPYGHLVLATGTRNRTLSIPGADLYGVSYLRTLPEASRLAAALRHCKSVAVIGAGFIGMEVAAAARVAGADVTVIEALDRPMARAVSCQTSRYFIALHERQGVKFRLGTSVAEIVGKAGCVAGVRTTSDERIDADLVVVGIGVIPNIELAKSAGLEVDNGIVVNAYLQTADENVSAIGDCASYPHEELGHLRLESIQNAVEHARCLANRLTGVPRRYQCIPWFWTEQFTVKLQMAGLVKGHNETVVRGDPSDGAFSVFCFAADRLVGVESVNKTRDHMAARKLLAKGVTVSREQAEDHDCDLKALLTTA
jgi:3-phenylpropionate/trans-cinnamate dioxygenase ferredoxin reductase subunit